MGLFRRGKTPDPEPPDGDFPFLTVAEAGRVRRMAQQAFAELGAEVVVHADHLVGQNGTEFGLSNLMAACHSSGRNDREWADLVQRHCRSILTAVQDSRRIEDLPLAEVLSRVYVRVMGAQTLQEPWRDTYRYGRFIGDDLFELLVLDSPESVTLMRHEAVDAFGVDVLRQAGLENLLREPIDEVTRVQLGQGRGFDVVLGDSVFTASHLLALPNLLNRVYGPREYPDGVLVAVPSRHQLGLHPLEGPGAVVTTNAMADFAYLGFVDGVGSVSPYLYWWRDGTLSRLTRVEDGTIVIMASEEFTEVVTRLEG